MKNGRWKLETSRKALLRKKETREGLKRKHIHLKRCKKGARCRGEHCQICHRILRKNLVKEARRLRLASKKNGWLMVTLTPNGPPIPIGGLDSYNLTKEVEKHRQKLRRYLPGVLIIGGIDFALKYEGGQVAGWQPHLHLLIYGISREESLNALRPAYPKSLFASKPIRHESVKGKSFNGALSYCYKSVFFPRGNPKMIPRNRKRPGLPRKYELELRAYLAK